jgi:hypothetical protein
MSFDERFKHRWSEVIAPAVRGVTLNGRHLEPFRVDIGRISDSILTEILSGINSSRLIFADVTTLEYVNGRAIRNGNVMYEVGIAHAVRLPEEVLLFRSDNDPLLFDMANVRTNSYSPDDRPEDAKKFLSECIGTALRELDLRRHMAVRQVSESLDIPSWWLLAETQSGKPLPHPQMNTMRQVLGNASRTAAIQRLLELGAIRTSYLSLTPEIFERIKDSTTEDILTYECTDFGRAIFKEGIRRMGIQSSEMKAVLEKQRKEKASQPDASPDGKR